VSADGVYVLNQKYLTTPLTFDIGPLLIASSAYESNQSLEAMSSALKNTNSFVLTFLR